MKCHVPICIELGVVIRVLYVYTCVYIYIYIAIMMPLRNPIGPVPDMSNTEYEQLLDIVLVISWVYMRVHDEFRQLSCMELCFASIWCFTK